MRDATAAAVHILPLKSSKQRISKTRQSRLNPQRNGRVTQARILGCAQNLRVTNVCVFSAQFHQNCWQSSPWHGQVQLHKNSIRHNAIVYKAVATRSYDGRQTNSATCSPGINHGVTVVRSQQCFKPQSHDRLKFKWGTPQLLLFISSH